MELTRTQNCGSLIDGSWPSQERAEPGFFSKHCPDCLQVPEAVAVAVAVDLGWSSETIAQISALDLRHR